MSHRKWLTGGLLVGLLLVPAASVKADGSPSIANAPLLVSGSTDSGKGSPYVRHRFWRIDLKAGDKLTVDFGTDNGSRMDICLLDPTVTDYTLSGANPLACQHTFAKQELAQNISTTGRWTIEMISCDVDCMGTDYQWHIIVSVKPVQQPGCSDIIVVDSRGSGEPANQLSPPGAAFVSTLSRQHPGNSFGTFTNPYPAIEPWKIVAGKFKLMPGYDASASAGKQWLQSKVQALNNQCPLSQIFLTGYSQGADVTATVFQADGVKVAGVVLFGDPRFNSADSWADRGSFVMSSTRKNGIFGARPTFGSLGKVLSFCHQYDPYCQFPPSKLDLTRYGTTKHSDYQKQGEPEAAAAYFSR